VKGKEDEEDGDRSLMSISDQQQVVAKKGEK
jgi:hypothetical protein